VYVSVCVYIERVFRCWRVDKTSCGHKPVFVNNLLLDKVYPDSVELDWSSEQLAGDVLILLLLALGISFEYGMG